MVLNRTTLKTRNECFGPVRLLDLPGSRPSVSAGTRALWLVAALILPVLLAACGLEGRDRRDSGAQRGDRDRAEDTLEVVNLEDDTLEVVNLPAGADSIEKGGPAAGTPIEVFFSNTYAGDPSIPRHDTANIDRRCAAFIASAKRTLDCAFFELENDRITDAVIAAHRRGVKVRMVGESDYEDNPHMQRVKAAGIPVRFDKRSGLMHDKFIVADKAATWTGSYNVTDNCSFRNNNNALVIRSRELASNYTVEFTEMFESGYFGPRNTAKTPFAFTTVGSTDIYNYFAPEDDVTAKVVRYLRAAKKSVHFMAFSFTDSVIAGAMIADARKGIAVEGVVESRGADGRGGQAPRLGAAGIPVLRDGNKYVMHHKVIVIDGLWTITGSYNFTSSAANSNDENILIIKNREVAGLFEKEYQRVKRMAQRAKPA